MSKALVGNHESGAIQTLESAGNADISMQSASGGGTKRQILTTRQDGGSDYSALTVGLWGR